MIPTFLVYLVLGICIELGIILGYWLGNFIAREEEDELNWIDTLY